MYCLVAGRFRGGVRQLWDDRDPAEGPNPFPNAVEAIQDGCLLSPALDRALVRPGLAVDPQGFDPRGDFGCLAFEVFVQLPTRLETPVAGR
ncbi:hypothetical protein Franean1_2662 [Parafrankia sp. EAN1pec]|nr:hypothetical protein Franean1_2662 [Frankia sp. EAN1pec]